MIKVELMGSKLIIDVLTAKKSKRMVIANGFVDGEHFNYLTFSDGKLFLEGERMRVLVDRYDGIIIKFANPLDVLVDHFGDVSILSDGVNAIPEGKEREALSVILGSYMNEGLE